MKDLYQLVNGPWLESHVIPDDRGVDGTFHALRDEAEELVHDIVQKDNGRPGKLYASFMDTEGVNPAWACRMRLITARKPTPKRWPPMKSMWQRCWSSSTQPAFSA